MVWWRASLGSAHSLKNCHGLTPKGARPAQSLCFYLAARFSRSAPGKAELSDSFYILPRKGWLVNTICCNFLYEFTLLRRLFRRRLFRKSGAVKRRGFYRKPEAARPWLFSKREGCEQLGLFQKARGRETAAHFKIRGVPKPLLYPK